jgi:hypothetical protein
VVEQMKKSNRRRKNPLSREQIDQMVEALLNKMGDAVDADIRAIQEKSPAFAKVKLLPEVVAMLQKYVMSLERVIRLHFRSSLVSYAFF